jgi:DNA-binding NarL/FixJ family response regulator
MDDPTLSGAELAARVRGHAKLRGTRLVIVARELGADETGSLDQLGVNAIVKDLGRRDELVAALRRSLRPRTAVTMRRSRPPGRG